MSPTLIHSGTILWASTDHLLFSLPHKFWLRYYGFIWLSFNATKPQTTLEWIGLQNMSPAAQGLHAKTEPGIQEAAPFLRDNLCPGTWHGVKPRCRASSAPLSAPDRPDPGSDRLALWGEAESRRSSDPTALLYVVYLQVLAPAQREKTGLSASTFPRQESEIDNAGAQNTSARPGGPCGAAKKWLELDHGLSRFSRPNGAGLIFFLCS